MGVTVIIKLSLEILEICLIILATTKVVSKRGTQLLLSKILGKYHYFKTILVRTKECKSQLICQMLETNLLTTTRVSSESMLSY